MNRNRITRFAAAVAGIAALGLGGGAAAQEPLKIGFVYVSPIGDAGWTFQHDQGRKELEKALGAKVQTKFVENVPEGADAERVIREFAAGGNKLVFTTSFGYMNPTIKVAQQFPNVMFDHATGYKTAKNVGVYNARFYEGRYLCGIIAGKMTKTNVAGYVAAFPIPEVVQGINAFAQGAGIDVASQLLSSLPYLATIVVLVIISRNVATIRLNSPVSLGRSYRPD